MAQGSIPAPGGVPAANEIDLPGVAGNDYTAVATPIDDNNQATGDEITSARFNMDDNKMVTVVLTVTGGQ